VCLAGPKAVPLVVRDGGIVVETLERIRVGLPVALRLATDVPVSAMGNILHEATGNKIT
jgi:hypothetical protein